MKAIMSREPLSEQEVWDYLTEEVERNIRQWGEDYIYTKWAKESREEKMAKFRNGEVVAVKTESYVDRYGNGSGDFSDTLYSDGTVKTRCYGYLD